MLTPDEGKQLLKQLVKLVDAHSEVVMKAFRKFPKFQHNILELATFLSIPVHGMHPPPSCYDLRSGQDKCYQKK